MDNFFPVVQEHADCAARDDATREQPYLFLDRGVV